MKVAATGVVGMMAAAVAADAIHIESNHGVNKILFKRDDLAVQPMAVPAGVAKRELQEYDVARVNDLIKRLKDHRINKEEATQELSKREYEIVTEVLNAINDTNLAPTILHYLATDSFFAPLAVSTIVAVLKSGLINLTVVLKALTDSDLIGATVKDLISDCSLYVDLFNTAKKYIGNLTNYVINKILGGLSKREFEEDLMRMSRRSEVDYFAAFEVDKRIDYYNIAVNLLESLKESGLVTSVVKDILTDSSYIPFAILLVSALLASSSLDLGSLLGALKDSGLAVSLFNDLANVQTFQTVIGNAFAAFAGDCSATDGPGSGSGSSGSGGSGSGTTTPSTGNSGSSGSGGSGSNGGSGNYVCKRRRRKRAFH